MDLVGLRDHAVDRASDHIHAFGNEAFRGLDHFGWVIAVEWDEKVPGLVVVLHAGVDDGHRPLITRQEPAQPIDHHGPGRAASEHQQTVHCFLLVSWLVCDIHIVGPLPWSQ